MNELSLYSTDQSRNKPHVYEGLDALRVVSSFGVVFLHVCATTGLPPALFWLMKFRDFALPTMILSSFFVLTVSLARKPENDFGRFFERRFARLGLPFLVWTLIYVLFIVFLAPLAMGASPAVESFSPVVFLTGHRHLWYLQFIFIGSLAVYFAIYRILADERFSRIKIFLLCAGISLGYGILYESFFKHLVWRALGADADIDLHIFVMQASRYLLFIPAGVGLGLVSDKIERLFRRALFRKISLVLALIALLLHTGSFTAAGTQELYGIAVFVAALQPWKKIAAEFWQKLVDYSYGIYILHFFPVHLISFLIAKYNPEIGAAVVLSTTIIVYFSSFCAAVLIKKAFAADWLLPMLRGSTSESPRISVLRLSLADEK